MCYVGWRVEGNLGGTIQMTHLLGGAKQTRFFSGGEVQNKNRAFPLHMKI